MTARQLLAEVEARGGTVAVACDTTGAAFLKITPRGLVPDLLPDIARFKPALLELIEDLNARDSSTNAVVRDRNSSEPNLKPAASSGT